MVIGTYLDLFTGEFDSTCVYDNEQFTHYLREMGKNIILLTADPEVPYFINAVVDSEGINWDEEEVVLNFRGEELS